MSLRCTTARPRYNFAMTNKLRNDPCSDGLHRLLRVGSQRRVLPSKADTLCPNVRGISLSLVIEWSQHAAPLRMVDSLTRARHAAERKAKEEDGSVRNKPDDAKARQGRANILLMSGSPASSGPAPGTKIGPSRSSERAEDPRPKRAYRMSTAFTEYWVVPVYW